MGRLHYLNWDQEERGPATEYFHEAHIDQLPSEIPKTDFDEHWRKVIELDVEPDSLEDIWAEFNRGSGKESRTFLNLRYCEPDKQYFDTPEEAQRHAVEEHGYEPRHDQDLPDYIHPERSMSVGDIVEIDDTYYIAKAIGFDEITIGGEH